MNILLFLALLTVSVTSNDAASDLPSLVAVMEALQAPVKDFRCEFEGENVYKGERAERAAGTLGPDGLAETFGGAFVWQRDGDRRYDLLKRRASGNQIAREIAIVHMRDKRTERSYGANDGSIGHVDIEHLSMQRINANSYFGELLPLGEIKEMVGDDTYETIVSNDEIEGRPLKRLTVYLKYKDIPNILARRYWIDLARSGQVVRVDSFLEKSLAVRWDITLKSFRVGDADVWMPISGEIKNYLGGQVTKSLVFTKEPTLLRSIRVIDGTMEFNKRPGASTFTLKHKPGTPISDQIRKLNYQFGQKQISNRPSKAEAETMLQEQIAEAEEQKRELVAVPREGIDWWTWSVAGLVGTLSASLAVLWLQRRPR